MPREIRIDVTEEANQPHLELTIRLRVPMLTQEESRDSLVRVSLDHLLEEIRQRMRSGEAAKPDEDHLVIFRLLQSAGLEYWPPQPDDLD